MFRNRNWKDDMKPFFDLYEIDFVEYGRINAEFHMWQMFWEKKQTINEYYEINQLLKITNKKMFSGIYNLFEYFRNHSCFLFGMRKDYISSKTVEDISTQYYGAEEILFTGNIDYSQNFEHNIDQIVNKFALEQPRKNEASKHT